MNYISLSTLSHQLKKNIALIHPNGVWIKGEISQMNVNQSSGHCYISLIEKDPIKLSPIAKINANIWKYNFEQIRQTFEHTTNTSIRTGIEIVVFANIDYSPIYGLSVNITRIDPTYNLGELAMQRLENIATLKQEGIFNMNKLIPFPSLPKRIAIISSATAAGYEDFIHQLDSSSFKHIYHTTLFHCLMQGEKSPESMLNALSEIIDRIDEFDCIAIIRGGGASSDLLAFDNIEIARICAQFPLPILTGIGHTRDESIMDMVAHCSLKTPTAVASFLIEKIISADEMVEKYTIKLNNAVNLYIQNAKNNIALYTNKLPHLCNIRIAGAENNINSLIYQTKNAIDRRIINAKNNISNISSAINISAKNKINRSTIDLNNTYSYLSSLSKTKINEQKSIIDIIEQKIMMSDPSSILKKGFTYTELNGKTITSAAEIKAGSEIQTYFTDGKINSVVK